MGGGLTKKKSPFIKLSELYVFLFLILQMLDLKIINDLTPSVNEYFVNFMFHYPVVLSRLIGALHGYKRK